MRDIPGQEDCLAGKTDGCRASSQGAQEAERPISHEGNAPLGRAVVFVENDCIQSIVTDRPGLLIAIADVGFHPEGETAFAPVEETVDLRICQEGELLQVDSPTVERVFGTAHEIPTHVRLSHRNGTKRQPPNDAYLTILNYAHLCGIDHRRMGDPATCIEVVRSLGQDTEGSRVVALHFDGEVLMGCSIERAVLWRATLLRARNLFRAALTMGGDSVALVYRPGPGCGVEVSPTLVTLAKRLARAGEVVGVTLRDFLMDTPPGEPMTGAVSLLHPPVMQPTPFD